MYFLYLDETGTNNENEHFVLGGCMISVNEWKEVNCSLNLLKKNYFKTESVDLKGLRRSNCKFLKGKIKNPFFELEKDKLNSFRDEYLSIINNSKIIYLAAVINKSELLKKYEEKAREPYLLSYEFLFERFNKFIKKNDSMGSIFLEYSNKDLINNLKNLHVFFRDYGTNYCFNSNIIEGCNIVLGPESNFTQVADLFIHGVFKKYEFGKEDSFDKYKHKLDCDKDGKIDGCGIKYFP